jgi:hypothetical protein
VLFNFGIQAKVLELFVKNPERIVSWEPLPHPQYADEYLHRLRSSRQVRFSKTEANTVGSYVWFGSIVHTVRTGGWHGPLSRRSEPLDVLLFMRWVVTRFVFLRRRNVRQARLGADSRGQPKLGLKIF